MGVSRISLSQTSSSGDAVLTANYFDDSVVQGKAFVFDRNFTILSGGTLYLLIDYTTYIPLPTQQGRVYVGPPVFTTSAGPVKVNVYRDTYYSGGNKLIAFNPNTLATKTQSGTTFTYGATGSNKGVLSLEYLVGGEGQGNNSANGSASGLGFYVRGNNTKTLVEIINQAAKDITFNNSQMYYEI